MQLSKAWLITTCSCQQFQNSIQINSTILRVQVCFRQCHDLYDKGPEWTPVSHKTQDGKYSQCLPQPSQGDDNCKQKLLRISKLRLLSFARNQNSLVLSQLEAKNARRGLWLGSDFLLPFFSFYATQMNTTNWELYARVWSCLRAAWTSWGGPM